MNYQKKIIYLKLLLLAYSINCCTQTVYKTGQTVANFKASKILNYTTAVSTLDSLGGQLTILDFFGTWCVPCIKALPNLSQLQQKFNGKLSIILISTEEPGRLEKFIAARKGFSFPVIADADGSITRLFEPPSFPYTLLLNKEKKIVGTIEASLITENEIAKWLSGYNSITEVRKTESEKNPPLPITMNTMIRSKNELVALSQNFLYAVKTGEETGVLEEKIRMLHYDELLKKLTTEDEKKAFWINIYNGFVQVLLKKNQEAYKSRSLFFSGKQIELANKKFSLDDIEHGILRRSKIKWSLGYFSKLFTHKIEKDLRVNKLDYRIHFALNCGAKSCPPVVFYNPDNLSTQLNIAATSYLTSEAEYDAKKNTVALPAIMGWFRKDFGGKKGMIHLLIEKGVIPAAANPSITFKSYDWSLYLNNYQN